MKIEKGTQNDTLILTLSGKLDSHTSPDLEEYIKQIDDFGKSNTVLDMTELDYISSAGLRLILNNSKLLKQHGKKFILCGMQDHIREIFEISGFDTFLDISKSLEKALAHAQEDGPDKNV